MRFDRNNFAVIGDQFSNPIATAVFPFVAMLNHSCEPNVVLKYDLVEDARDDVERREEGQDQEDDVNPSKKAKTKVSTKTNIPSRPRRARVLCTLVAIRDIEVGDEICHSYVDIGQDAGNRRMVLSERYGFDCDCARCQRDREDKQQKPPRNKETDRWKGNGSSSFPVRLDQPSGVGSGHANGAIVPSRSPSSPGLVSGSTLPCSDGCLSLRYPSIEALVDSAGRIAKNGNAFLVLQELHERLEAEGMEDQIEACNGEEKKIAEVIEMFLRKWKSELASPSLSSSSNVDPTSPWEFLESMEQGGTTTATRTSGSEEDSSGHSVYDMMRALLSTTTGDHVEEGSCVDESSLEDTLVSVLPSKMCVSLLTDEAKNLAEGTTFREFFIAFAARGVLSTPQSALEFFLKSFVAVSGDGGDHHVRALNMNLSTTSPKIIYNHSGLQMCISRELDSLIDIVSGCTGSGASSAVIERQRTAIAHSLAIEHCRYLVDQYVQKYPAFHPILALQRWSLADLCLQSSEVRNVREGSGLYAEVEKVLRYFVSQKMRSLLLERLRRCGPGGRGGG
ncbi:unnamed protein product [Amoebophrya sp. A25]|nr:unnamed protein product [Amoebophrya sp. A25]|eukprot:GSA25T00022751001.1